MILQAKSITDRIRQRNLLDPSTSIGVKGVIGKDVSVTDSGQDRFLTLMATTDDIDADGEIVIPSGANTSYFFNNRKIFVDHQLGTEHCVGVLHSANLKPNGWLVRLRMFSLPGNPLPDDILTIAREAGIGCSIGFIPTDVGPPTPEEQMKYGKGKPVAKVIRAWDWLELSITAAPCNVACQSLALSRNEGKIAALDELVTKGRIQARSAYALGLPVPKIIVPLASGLTKARKRTVIVVD